MWYSSLVNSSTIYTVLEYTKLEYLFKKKKKKKIYTILEFGKLEYCVFFFLLLFGDNQKINIKVNSSTM